MDALFSEDVRLLKGIQANLSSCILGKEKEIELLLTAMLAGGHVLLEDVPGTGKTLLIKALARSINGQFRRIQCNPDLLPTDITGVSIFHPKEEEFIFRPGPVQTNILLADEINRATTKTQSALLEAMEERAVTVDGVAYHLPTPFLLMATQNPIDFEGTYVLPEAQLDRFMMKFSLGYPDHDTEKRMLFAQAGGHPVDTLQPVVEVQRVLEMQKRVREVHVDDAVADYVVSLTRKTREHTSVLLGASPRATLSLMQAAKAYAYVQGRDYVIPDDIKTLVPSVLGHRMILHSEARIEGTTLDTVFESIYSQVRVPIRIEK
ncbi:AAA family ATPase [Paenibacillus koleovorans]|uniref:AAA family ATPase n=1 Tax=Paenibacillus koleovorans TaxID=121608 RepID=UPI000FDAE353|nr:MoxR family ATPase [Paenibacillus koleovorans]